MTDMATMSKSIETLLKSDCSACDISDALLKLDIPNAGFLPDILPISNLAGEQDQTWMIGPASTVLFIPKSSSDTTHGASNIPPGKHWTDVPPPGSIALLQQPPEQICAVMGDILATRLKVRGVRGAVVDGRVRDLVSLRGLAAEGGAARETGFGVYARGTSTVGTGLEAKAWSVGVPLTIGGVVVAEGDLVYAAGRERGVVVIPRDRLEEVMEILPGLKKSDDAVLEDVRAGVDVLTAFRRHRGS